MFNLGVAVPQMLGMMHGIVSVALMAKSMVITCMCRRQLVTWVEFLHCCQDAVCLHVHVCIRCCCGHVCARKVLYSATDLGHSVGGPV